MLASADVLVALLETDAGAFSVPSKVLTSLSAGRPILAAIPAVQERPGRLRTRVPGSSSSLATEVRS